MAGGSISVDILSLRDLHKALRKVNPYIEKNLKRDLKAVAGVVASEAKNRVPSRSGRAASSIGSGATTKGGYVKGGKASVPYYGWLDFGSRTPIRGNPRSWGPWTLSGKGPAKGRFIYPAIEDKSTEITSAVQAAVSRAIDAAGF